MATKSQQVLFHVAANKQKVDLQKPMPSRVTTSFVSTKESKGGFWQKRLDAMDKEDNDLPPEIEEDGADEEAAAAHDTTDPEDDNLFGGNGGGSKTELSVSKSSASSPPKQNAGWTTVAPEDDDVAKDFFVERLRRIYASKDKPFDEDKYRRMSLKNLRFKYNRSRTDQDVQANVRMFRFVLLGIFLVIEKIVTRFIKVAKLQNYTMKLSKSTYMKDLDRDLKKLVQRYFRSGSINPFVGIFGTMVCTMTMYNFDPTFLDPPKIQKRRQRPARKSKPKQMPQPSFVNETDEDSDSDLGGAEDGDASNSMAMSMMSSLMKNEKIQGLIANALPEMLGSAM